jgi:hypothetical protein
MYGHIQRQHSYAATIFTILKAFNDDNAAMYGNKGKCYILINVAQIVTTRDIIGVVGVRTPDFIFFLKKKKRGEGGRWYQILVGMERCASAACKPNSAVVGFV